MRGLGFSGGKKSLSGTSKQPINHPSIRGRIVANQVILPLRNPDEFKGLARLDAVLPPDFNGQNNLSF